MRSSPLISLARADISEEAHSYGCSYGPGGPVSDTQLLAIEKSLVPALQKKL
jgi:hypothetical protein